MADDVVLNPGSGGDTIAADDVGSKKYQIVKLAYGVDGSVTLASTTDPVPVDLTNITATAPLYVSETATPATTVVESGDSRTRTQDLEVRALLHRLLEEQRKTNSYMALMMGVEL